MTFKAVRTILSVLLVLVGTIATAEAQTPETTLSNSEVHNQSTIGGTALPLVPQNDTDTVSLVAVGDRVNESIPVVVHNGTDSNVTEVTVKAEARDQSGNLVGVGETSVGHAMKPIWLAPGDISIGFVILSGDLPAGVDYTFKVTYETKRSFEISTDVEFTEVSWLGDRIVGELRNPSDRPIEYMYLTIMCFSNDGSPLVADPAGLQEVVRPGETTTFQVGEYTRGIESCENFLIAGYGNYADS